LCSERPIKPREAILRKPWLLPFLAALFRGADTPRDVSDLLGCSRKLAVSGLYMIDKMNVKLDAIDFCVLRWKSWFAARIGSVYIVAKVGKRRVKAYTVPSFLLSKAEVGGKLGYRAGIVKKILDNGVKFAGCEEGIKTKK